MRIHFLNLILLSSFLLSFAQQPANHYQVIPEPESIRNSESSIIFSGSVKIFAPKQALEEAKMLQENLLGDFGMKSQIVEKADQANIVFKLGANSDNNEAYTLEVNKNKTVISAATSTGIFYGIQSLRQIIQKYDNKLYIQQGTIMDSPAFSWRSFMLDESRHFKGKQAVKNLLEEMALLKMNIFQWHLTDDQGWRIEIKKYPKLTEIGSYRDSTEINFIGSKVCNGKAHSGFYTQEDIKEIVAYATKLHIQIVPEIEMPGHASAAIAAYPWLGATGKRIQVPCYFGVMFDVYNVVDPRVMTFFNDVFDELIPLFPSPVFHIGGDEVRYNQWNESEQVKQYMDKNGLQSAAELQVYFTNTISNLLKNKGKRMMGWNEITGDNVHDYQKSIDTKANNHKLAEGTIVQFWRGDSTLILKTINNGYEIVNSNNEFTYLDYDYKTISLSMAYSFNPIPKGIPKNKEKNVIGLGCQMWGEMIPTVESMNYKVYPRIAAYAETGWTTPKNKNFQRFVAALPQMLNRWSNKGINYGPLK
ncbi:MAG: beta-N-acetylhexosaminidase [Paludibacter sp.]|nr:beta-N-acetylhexosaminidase [Paludibacter sp.]